MSGPGADARSVVLGRIREALGEGAPRPAAEAAWERLPRGYRRAGELSYEERLELFEDRLRDYDSSVERVSGALADAIELQLERRGQDRMLVPPGLPEGMLARGSRFVVDDGLSHAALEGFGGIVTMATLGIATTGTLVLQNVPGQGRRVTSLLPDYHLCVLDGRRVVETVPEAMAWLQATAALPTTFISGPSATADIEMTRIKGVHGPRVLDVLLLVTPSRESF